MTPNDVGHLPAGRPGTTKVLGHRGASGYAPENTIEAYELAREQGADGVELDARRTADGHVVVHHDPLLAGGQVIAGCRLADLPPEVPTLAAALDACHDLLVNIELKNIPGEIDFDPTDRLAGMVGEVLRARGGTDRVLISSFNPYALARFASRDAATPAAWLTLGLPDRTAAIDVAVRMGLVALHPWDSTVDKALVDMAHAAGIDINVWTVDEPDRIAELGALGVDAVVTDVPDVALRALGRPAPVSG